MLWNSNTVIRQKAEDVSTAIFRGSGRTSRLHWIICFAICSQTGSWLKQADCSYSYQCGLFGHVCDQHHSILRTRAQLLLMNFLYDLHCVSFFFQMNSYSSTFHTQSFSMYPLEVCAVLHNLTCSNTGLQPSVPSCRLNLCEFSRPLALQRGKRYIFRIDRKTCCSREVFTTSTLGHHLRSVKSVLSGRHLFFFPLLNKEFLLLTLVFLNHTEVSSVQTEQASYKHIAHT